MSHLPLDENLVLAKLLIKIGLNCTWDCQLHGEGEGTWPACSDELQLTTETDNIGDTFHEEI